MMLPLLGLVWIVQSTGAVTPLGPEADRRALLAIHEEFKAAHLRADADAVLGRLAESYVQVNRGEVRYPESAEMASRMQEYLESTRFTHYRDLRPPVVRVSADGTLGWVIVQLEARGVRAGPDGSERPVDFVCAWIYLFEKHGGRWTNVGDVSTFKGD